MLSSVSPRNSRSLSRHNKTTLNRQIRNLRQSTSSSRTATSSSQNSFESSTSKHRWVQTRQINIIINRLTEFISGLNISRNSINDLNQYLDNLKHLVSVENSHHQSLSTMTVNFWKAWNDFSVNLNTALNSDESPRILSFVKEQFNSAENTIRKIQAKINPAMVDPDQKLQQLFDRFGTIQQIESFETVDNISDIISDAKKIYLFVKQNNKQLFTSQVESDYALKSIERGIQSLSFVSNDDNLRDELVNQYRSAYDSFKKLVPESNIKVRGKSVPNDNQPKTSSILAPQPATKSTKQKADDAASKKKKKPKPPVFDNPYVPNQSSRTSSSKKRAVTPPSMRHHSRHRMQRQSAMNAINANQINIDSISIAQSTTSSSISQNSPPKFRNNADYIMETQKTQIQQRRKHRNKDNAPDQASTVTTTNTITNNIPTTNTTQNLPSTTPQTATLPSNIYTERNVTLVDQSKQPEAKKSHSRERKRRWNIIEGSTNDVERNLTIQIPSQQPQKEAQNDQTQKQQTEAAQSQQTTAQPNGNNQIAKSETQSPRPVPLSPSSFANDKDFESFVDATDVKPYVLEMPAPLEANQNESMLSPSDVFGDDEGESDSMSVKFKTTASEIARRKKRSDSSHKKQEQPQQQTQQQQQQEQSSSTRKRHSKHAEAEKQQQKPSEQQKPQLEPQKQPVQTQEAAPKHKHQSDASKSHKHSKTQPEAKPAPTPAPAPTPPKPAPAPAPAPAQAKPAPAPAAKPAAAAQPKKDDEYYDDYYDDGYYDDGYYDD